MYWRTNAKTIPIKPMGSVDVQKLNSSPLGMSIVVVVGTVIKVECYSKAQFQKNKPRFICLQNKPLVL